MNNTYGLLAQFKESDTLLAAARKAKDAGYRSLDAFSPYPVHGLDEALGVKKTKLPLLVLIGGIMGALTGYLLQYYVSAIGYPLNIAGRPLNSIPSFVPVTFELTILFAGTTAVVGMLALNGFPRPYHSVFNAPNFARASRDRYFLLIESAEPLFDAVKTKSFLNQTGAEEVVSVEV